MIPRKEHPDAAETAAARPVESGEGWLGRNTPSKHRLWERLNPRHRKQLRLVARALVLRQSQARLPEAFRAQLAAATTELEHLVARIEKLLAAVASRTTPMS